MSDLIFVVTEVDSSLETQTARFRLKNAFFAEAVGSGRSIAGVLYSEPTFRVSTAVLEHRIPCLGFAIEEAAHVNVWKNRLAELGLPLGPWLRELKRAVIENRPSDHLIRIGARPTSPDMRELPLDTLRSVLTVTPGQKVAYVTDAADTPANRAAIIQAGAERRSAVHRSRFCASGYSIGGRARTFDDGRRRKPCARGAGAAG